MTAFDPGLLAEIAAADDLHIAPFRPDGVTTGTPTWIWSVVVDGQLYVRPWHGARSRWYQAAITQRAGQITTAGHTIDVTFTAANAADPAIHVDLDAVDGAYRTKYASSSYLPPMVATGPRSTTVCITPRHPPADQQK